MASIIKRKTKTGISYQAKIRLKGYPPQSESFRRLTDAKKWVIQTESAILEGRHFKTAESKKRTFNDLMARYYSDILPNYSSKEQGERKSKLDWWCRGIGHYVLADTTPSVISDYKKTLVRSPATIDKYLRNLSHVFTFAVNELEWIEQNPVRKVKSPKLPRGRVRFLSDEEREQLLDACRESDNKMLYVIVVLALSTGMRQGEIMNLKWPDVDLNQAFLILHETKNDERRRVSISGHALETLKEYSKVRRLDSELVFSGRTGKPAEIRKPWLKALEVGQIDNFKFHDLRHSAASYLAMNGASLAEIAEVLGHKTLQMVKRYAHLSESHTSKVVASMNEKIFRTSE